MPEPTRPSASQPQAASSQNGASTASSAADDAPAGSGQPPQAPPRHPREVPPRFRHQEQKQLLKRGQHFPAIAANLGSAVKLPGSPPESSGAASTLPPGTGEAPASRSQPPGEHCAWGHGAPGWGCCRRAQGSRGGVSTHPRPRAARGRGCPVRVQLPTMSCWFLPRVLVARPLSGTPSGTTCGAPCGGAWLGRGGRPVGQLPRAVLQGAARFGTWLPCPQAPLTLSASLVPDVSRSGPAPQHAPPQRGPAPPPSDSSTDCGDATVTQPPERATWPSAPGSDLELGSECLNADPVSSSEPERSAPLAMASGSAGADKDGLGLRSGAGLGAQSKFLGGGVGHTGGPGPWAVSPGAVISTCPVSVDVPEGTPESGGSRMSAWGAVSPPSDGGLSPSTLSPASGRGAWPGLESSGLALKGPAGGGAAAQGPPSPSPNSKVSGSAHGAWGALQQPCESEVSGTQQAAFSGQPQSTPTEMPGPNNTTNFVTSSLPNCGSVPGSELPGTPGAWRMSTGSHPQIQAPSVTNGPSLSHLSNGDANSGGSYGTAWGAYGSSCSGDRCPSPHGPAHGDTVKAALAQPGGNGPTGTGLQVNSNKGGGVWESGPASSQGAPWAGGSCVSSGGVRRGWGTAQSTGTSVPGVEWGTLPGNQHSSDGAHGGGKTFTNGWRCAEDEELGPGPCQTGEQSSVWAKTGGTVDSEGSTESTGRLEERAVGESQSRDRRKVDQHTLLQSIVSRTDLDPRVLSNSGWGQTPIKQNTAWDTETSPRGDRKADNGTEAWGSCATLTFNSGACPDKTGPNSNDTSSGSGWGEPRPALRWGDSRGSSCQGGWEGDAAAMGMAKSNQWGGCKEEKSTWTDAQKGKQGWGDGQKPGPGWAVSAGDSWGDAARSNHWGEAPKKSSSGGSDSDRSVSGWNELGKTTSFTWANNLNPNNSSGWDESSKPSPAPGWGEPPKPGPALGWGEPSKPLGSPDWSKQPDAVGSWGLPPAPAKPSGTGWLGGPIPAPTKEEEATGWEEPSPESIRRKMEIDDGTSAWGDPGKYNYKHVSMWNRNVPGGGRADPQAQAHPLLPSAGALPAPEAGGGSGKLSPGGRAASLTSLAPHGASAGAVVACWGARMRACSVLSSGDAVGRTGTRWGSGGAA